MIIPARICWTVLLEVHPSFSDVIMKSMLPILVIICQSHARLLWGMMPMLSISTYSIRQLMHTGYPIISHAEKQFKPKKPYFAGECADWLNWLSHSQGTKIQHGLTTGERRIGKYKVNGYCEATKTIYEFHSCWGHMHACIDWNKYDDRKHP